MYGWSIVHCLPSLAEQPVGRDRHRDPRDTVHELAAKAGFSVDALRVDGGFFRLYRFRLA